MTRISSPCSVLLVAAALLAISILPIFADGESSVFLVNSGIIVPVTETHVQVPEQSVTITLPTPTADQEMAPAHIRVVYSLLNDSDKPLDLTVAWPTGARSGEHPNPPQTTHPVYIKLDDTPIASTFLDYFALAEQYIQPWMEQIDALLQEKPELRDKVLELRRETNFVPRELTVAEHIETYQDAVSYLGSWMDAHGYYIDNDIFTSEYISRGLLNKAPGIDSWHDRNVQAALKWLDPSYQQIDLYEAISQRWDYRPLLLDPNKEWLNDVSHGMIYPDEAFADSFGIIRFPISLVANKKQTLIVDYQHSLSLVGHYVFNKKEEQSGYARDYYGLVYIMEPARRWGRWDKTTINICVPNGWKKVAIRPRPTRVSEAPGMKIYHIEMPHRPNENLYVSVVP